MKRIIRFAELMLLVVAAMTISACGGYEATTLDRQYVESVIDRFQFGVERYDILLMTGDLSDAFRLTLQEGRLRYDKELPILMGELAAEETDQVYWRGAFGYVLKLVLTGGDLSFADRYATAHSGFTVIESARDIAPITTDTGTIDWQFVKMGDYWRVAAMTITFDTSASALSSTRSVSIPGSPFFRRSSKR